MKQLTNLRRTITFRQIFITLCILMFANICMTALTGSTSAVKKPTKALTTLHKCADLTHENCDGVCSCDGLGCLISMSNTGYVDPKTAAEHEDITIPNPNYHFNFNYDDEMRENMRDYQLDIQHNGDIIIYCNEEDRPEYVGTYKKGSKCDIIQMINKHIADND